MAQIQLQLCRLGLHIFSAMPHCWSDSWECKWGRPQEVPEGVKYQQHKKKTIDASWLLRSHLSFLQHKISLVLQVLQVLKTKLSILDTSGNLRFFVEKATESTSAEFLGKMDVENARCLSGSNVFSLIMIN